MYSTGKGPPEHLGDGDGWTGPHIYDRDGSLVWSSVPLLENARVEDFRLSRVDLGLGDGVEDVMTVMNLRRANGLFIDKHYQVRKREKVGGPGLFNSHEFHVVEDGTKALVVYTDMKKASEEESRSVGVEGRCQVACNGINEYDVKTWESTFTWSSCAEEDEDGKSIRGEGHIALDESTLNGGIMEKKCRHNWDYVHANSVDKTPEGDYLFSCRHSDAIYKISRNDGRIVWRLGGVKSDFQHIANFNFSRQHDIRYREGNATHTIVSILDNAKGMDSFHGTTHPFSRGLLIALDEASTPMTARVIASYDHPDRGHAFRRGNYQSLPNGNVFMSWAEQGLQSEHSADGKMLMQARLKPDWLGTYRAYKFDGFVGTPDDPPDVVARAVEEDKKEDGMGMRTEVFVSWNGATEAVSPAYPFGLH